MDDASIGGGKPSPRDSTRETAAWMRAGGGRAPGRAEEYVESCASFEVACAIAYAVAGRVDDAWFDRSRLTRTLACLAIACAAHGARWTLGVVATAMVFHILAARTRGTRGWGAGRRTAACACATAAALAVGERLELASVGARGFMGRTSFTAHRAFRYDALRLMSYSVDCALGHGEICFARCVRYVLYPSLRQCGPFLFYRDFETKRCDGADFRGRLSYAALEMMDSLAWYAFLRFARRTLSSPVDEGLGTARKLALAWTHTTAVWAGPTLVFNFHHALAVFEGQVVARDVFEFWTSSATSFTSFWRRFHVSLHDMFVTYIHRPLGSNIVSIIVVMAFSLLFHGLSDSHWVAFFAVNTAGVCAERVVNLPGRVSRTWTTALYQTCLFALFLACTTPIDVIDRRFTLANFCIFFAARLLRRVSSRRSASP